jgi:heavy-metal resistance protein
MKKGAVILLFGLLLATAGFCGFYYAGTAPCRDMMREPQPELAWLKKEFKLSDAEFKRISQLHAAYLPQCAARCQRIEEQNQKLKQLFSQATTVTPEIQNLLNERAKMRADCEAEMMKHFMEVSRTMPAEQGRRYLDWVEKQTFLHGQGMEERHRTGPASQAPHQHSV